MPFVYSLDAQNALVDSLTKDRLTAYLSASKGNAYLAIQLYEYNTRVSESLYGVTQALEIACRNACHSRISKDTGSPCWYDSIGLDQKESQSVLDAKNNIQRWGKQVVPARVVAELTFGFWVRLFSPGYEKRLWVPHLYKAFPHLPKPARSRIFDRMEKIRKLRNRIAHHEPIIGRPLRREYDDILEAIGWICPVTERWIQSTNTFVVRAYS